LTRALAPLSLYLSTRQRNPCFFFIPCS
jgi:hypothetical protein